MSKVIVVIGGGDIRRGGTTAIDREIVDLSRKKSPKLLFIPTASSDDAFYCKHVQQHFGKSLGCKVDFLLLIKEHPSKRQIKKKIMSADIIYVGSGNTLMMMRLMALGRQQSAQGGLQKGSCALWYQCRLDLLV